VDGDTRRYGPQKGKDGAALHCLLRGLLRGPYPPALFSVSSPDVTAPVHEFDPAYVPEMDDDET
jgi:hypothetical protein